MFGVVIMAHPITHRDVEVLDRMVLLLSNKQGDDRMFIEVPDGRSLYHLAVLVIDSSATFQATRRFQLRRVSQ